MKKIVAIFGICSIIFACTNSEKSSTTDDSTGLGENQSAAAQQSSVDTNVNKIGTSDVAGGSAKGEQLISSSDCLTCHKVDAKIIGPSYMDVAKKYSATESNIEMLAGKIIQGGAGVWGDIPMAPHPNISKDDAKEMVKYVLALNSK